MALNRKIKIIGYASGWGAQIKETEQGPTSLQQSKIIEHLYDDGLNICWDSTIYPTKKHNDVETDDRYDYLPIVIETNKRLSTIVNQKLENKDFPVIIGGDHSMAAGTWSTIIDYYNEEEVGLIWIDAHMDSNTYSTSYSKAIHGMPLAALLGENDKDLGSICPKPGRISPKNLVLIGIRSFESGEEEFLKSLNVKIFYMDDIKKLGFKKVWDKAITHIKSNTSKFGLSIDLDAFDPEEAPGVGSPEEDGITFADFKNSNIKDLSNDDGLVGIEIAEYNPERDIEQKTAKLTEDILRLILLGK